MSKSKAKGGGVKAVVTVIVVIVIIAALVVWGIGSDGFKQNNPLKFFNSWGKGTASGGGAGTSGSEGNGGVGTSGSEGNGGGVGTPGGEITECVITWGIADDNGLVHISADIPEKGVAGERVTFVAQLMSDYDCEIERIDIYAEGLAEGVSAKIGCATYEGNCTYSFIMPDCDIELEISISEICVEREYTITYSTEGGPYPKWCNFYCETSAKPGDLVTAAIERLEGDDKYKYEITEVVLQNASTGEAIETLEKFNEFYEFTMPACNVNVCVYFETTKRAISYYSDLDGTDVSVISKITRTSTNTYAAYAGETVTFNLLTVVPGYKLVEIFVGVDGIDIRKGEVTYLGNDNYSFVMPDYDNVCVWIIYELEDE